MEQETVLKGNHVKTAKPEPQQQEYIEILGDTVVPSRILMSIIISILFSIGGFILGKSIFPRLAEAKMVPSYSLLLGIGGSVLALVLCARLFRPSRILRETETSSEGLAEILSDLQADPKAEYELLKEDPVTKKELEKLGILELFKRSGGG